MIKRMFSRDLYRNTQVIENSDGTFTPTVAVTGSKVEVVEETLVERDVYTSVSSQNFSVPENVSYVEFILKIHGMTGDFTNEGDGVSVKISDREPQLSGVAQIGLGLESEKIKSSGFQKIIFGKQNSFGEYAVDFEGNYKTTYHMPVVFMRCNFSISGVFGSGEGVDLELIARWFY